MPDLQTPPDLAVLRGGVNRVLEAFVDQAYQEADALAKGDRHLPLLHAAAAELVMRGGKRLRALFCLLGWIGAGGDRSDAGAVRAAASLELLHGCALIHDDVMDRSATRRGGPSVHRVFADVHRKHGWRGDPDQFGEAAAIAAGDLCLTWADVVLRSCGLPGDAIARARPTYDSMRAETIRGQYHDLLAQARGGVDIGEATDIARAKTAACTTRGPLVFGGALAGAPELLSAQYEGYGMCLGLAFQMRDDLLGAFGDSAATGKPSGDDLRDGKCTVLLAQAHELSDEAGRERLRALVAEGTDESVAELRTLIEDCGARRRVEDAINENCEVARQCLDAAELKDDSVRAPLAALIELVTSG